MATHVLAHHTDTPQNRIQVPEACPRVLINPEVTGVVPGYLRLLGVDGGFEFATDSNIGYV